MKLSSKSQEFLANNKGKKIVFTNGCFDILHRGHITYLNEAQRQGDLLFLGLNSDASVSRLKGPERPINSQEDRKFVLENLRSIDCVEIFEEDTPLDLILNVRPDILVKGGDWAIEDIVGSKEVLSWGGEAKSLNFIDGFSTTNTIEKIKK